MVFFLVSRLYIRIHHQEHSIINFICIQDGVTSLMIAVYHGSSEVIDILLNAKADVNISDVVR